MIGRGSSVPNYFFGTKLYINGSDCVAPIIGKIPLCRKFPMIIICGFVGVVDLSFYAVDIHTVLQMICHIRLRVLLISPIYIDQLKAMLLSALNSYFIFPDGHFKYPSAFWDFYGVVFPYWDMFPRIGVYIKFPLQFM